MFRACTRLACARACTPCHPLLPLATVYRLLAVTDDMSPHATFASLLMMMPLKMMRAGDCALMCLHKVVLNEILLDCFINCKTHVCVYNSNLEPCQW